MAERAKSVEIDPTTQKDLEAQFLRHKNVCEQAKAEYEKIYKEMLTKLSATHLEPFAEVLKQHENCDLFEGELLVDEMQQKLMNRMQHGLDTFWKEYEVTDRLAQLEILKLKFKDCNINWNINKKNVGDRTLPIRMRFKAMRVRHLNKHLEYQKMQLEELYKVTAAQRTRLQEIEDKRIYLKAYMDRQKDQWQKYITRFKEFEAKHVTTINDGDGSARAEID